MFNTHSYPPNYDLKTQERVEEFPMWKKIQGMLACQLHITSTSNQPVLQTLVWQYDARHHLPKNSTAAYELLTSPKFTQPTAYLEKCQYLSPHSSFPFSS